MSWESVVQVVHGTRGNRNISVVGLVGFERQGEIYCEILRLGGVLFAEPVREMLRLVKNKIYNRLKRLLE